MQALHHAPDMPIDAPDETLGALIGASLGPPCEPQFASCSCPTTKRGPACRNKQTPMHFAGPLHPHAPPLIP